MVGNLNQPQTWRAREGSSYWNPERDVAIEEGYPTEAVAFHKAGTAKLHPGRKRAREINILNFLSYSLIPANTSGRTSSQMEDREQRS